MALLGCFYFNFRFDYKSTTFYLVLFLLSASVAGDYVSSGLIKAIPRHGWICLACGKRNKSKSTITRHVDAIHTHKKYVCPICGYINRSEESRQRHMKKIHKVKLGVGDIRNMEVAA